MNIRFHPNGAVAHRLTCVAVAGCLLACSGAAAVDLVAARDNTLYEDPNGLISNGAGYYLFAGENNGTQLRRALLYFDLTADIPVGSTIHTARLTLTMSKTIAGATNVSAHRVLASWGEGASAGVGGEGQGAPAAPGDATWTFRFFPGPTWITAGGDFVATPSAVTSVAGVGIYDWIDVQLLADVQAWADDPSANFGWILIGDEATHPTVKRFNSRENLDEGSRPVLSIEFTPPACDGDADGDGDVDQDDLDLVLFFFGTSQPPGTNGDVDGDGDVDQDDLDLVLFNFGCQP